MSDALLLGLVTAVLAAIPPTLVAAATLVMTWHNGRKTDRVAGQAALAAARAGEAREELANNTKVTVSTAAAVDKVQVQTNGARERLDALLSQALKDIASQGMAIGVLQAKLAESEKRREPPAA